MRRAVIVLLLLAGTAAAQTAQEQAQARYMAGKQHYDLAEWDEAIEAFKEAYRLDPDPLFLFNVAQAYRLKGDCAQALTFYKTYLREATDAYNREKVEKRIEEMRTCSQEPEVEPPLLVPKPQPPELEPRPQPLPDAKSAAQPKSRSNMLLNVGMGVGGVGVVLIAGALYESFNASADARDLEALCSNPCTADGETIHKLDQHGKRAELLATIGYITGGVTVAAAAGMLIWDSLERRRLRELAVAPTRGGAMVQAAFHF